MTQTQVDPALSSFLVTMGFQWHTPRRDIEVWFRPISDRQELIIISPIRLTEFDLLFIDPAGPRELALLLSNRGTSTIANAHHQEYPDIFQEPDITALRLIGYSLP